MTWAASWSAVLAAWAGFAADPPALPGQIVGDCPVDPCGVVSGQAVGNGAGSSAVGSISSGDTEHRDVDTRRRVVVCRPRRCL